MGKAAAKKNRNETKGNEEKRHCQGKTREIIGVPWNQGENVRWPKEIRFGPQQGWKDGLDKWFNAVKAARKSLGITGFCPVGGKSAKGQALLKKVRSLAK